MNLLTQGEGMSHFDVLSEITGVVIAVEVAVGAQLAVDDAIALLESMKMEVPLVAPKAGVLAELFVSEGDEVTEGQVVARIEA